MSSVIDDPLVRFVNVDKTYDGQNLILDNLNLNVMKGEFMSLLGPSGSGKTTCLNLLAGFHSITRGDIYLEDKLIKNLPPYKRGIGVVFQNYALFPHMTISENLGFPLLARKLPSTEISERVTRALDMVRLSDFGDRYPKQLSGGQQQRVALARALIFEPNLVLLDEPLGALDKNLREQMQFEIKHIHEDLGITMVFVTHDQGEALTMSDRIAVLDEGKIQQLATPADLYERPSNSFVANFVGENNNLHGKVVETNGATCQVAIDGGGTIYATPGNGVTTGLRTQISIRPDCVSINPEKSQFGNCIPCRVEEVSYHGDHIRVRVNLLGNDEFYLNVPRLGIHQDLQVGQEIRVGWAPVHCHALDELNLVDPDTVNGSRGA